MGFVFIFRSASERRRADQLAKALRERGLEVVVGLQSEPQEVRSSVSRALADHCSVMAALWTEADASDASFVEPMRHAASLGKLLALSPPGRPPPANLGPVVEVSQNWTGDKSEFESLVEAILHASIRNSPAGDAGASSASDEYAAYQRMHRQGSVDAMARFLREYPGGMFEEIVRAELDAATRPTYQPARRNVMSFGDGDGDAPGRVWRMAEWAPLRALRGFAKIWPWAGVAALALGAAGLASVVPWGSVQQALNAPPPAQAREVAGPSASVRIEPEAVEAAEVLEEPQAVEQRQEAALEPAAPLRTAEREEMRREETRSPERAASAPEREPEPVQVAAAAPPQEQPRTQAAPPPATVPTPPTSTIVTNAYDISQLEPDQREALERARRSEARALTAARGASDRTAPPRGSASGIYNGQWSSNGASGLGRATWSNGDAYAGNWRTSRPHGYGVLRLAGGMRYEGEFADGAPTGRGVFWGADGRRLTGDTLFAALVRARTR